MVHGHLVRDEADEARPAKTVADLQCDAPLRAEAMQVAGISSRMCTHWSSERLTSVAPWKRRQNCSTYYTSKPACASGSLSLT